MVRGEKEQTEKKEPVVFPCAVCGVAWESKIKRAGPRLCSTCVELRRSINGFLNRGLIDVYDLEERLATIVEGLKAEA